MNDNLSNTQKILVDSAILQRGFDDLRADIKERVDGLSNLVGKLHSEFHDFRETIVADHAGLEARLSGVESSLSSWRTLATPIIDQVRLHEKDIVESKDRLKELSIIKEKLWWVSFQMWIVWGILVAAAGSVLISVWSGMVKAILRD